jgi:hypothetical protein
VLQRMAGKGSGKGSGKPGGRGKPPPRGPPGPDDGKSPGGDRPSGDGALGALAALQSALTVTVSSVKGISFPPDCKVGVRVWACSPLDHRARSDLLVLLGVDNGGRSLVEAAAGARSSSLSRTELLASLAGSSDPGVRFGNAVCLALDGSRFNSRVLARLALANARDGAWSWPATTCSPSAASEVLLLELYRPAAPSSSGGGSSLWLVVLPEWFAGKDLGSQILARAESDSHADVTARTLHDQIGPIGWGGGGGDLPLCSVGAHPGGLTASPDGFCRVQLAFGKVMHEGSSIIRRDSLGKALFRSRAGGIPHVAAASIDDASLTPETLTITVLPHSHTRYCDRTLRVCTAEGRCREGNSLTVDTSSIPEIHSIRERATEPSPREALSRERVSVTWFRSVSALRAVKSFAATGVPSSDSSDDDGEEAPLAVPSSERREVTVGGVKFVEIPPMNVPPSVPPAFEAGTSVPVEWNDALMDLGMPLDMPHLPPTVILTTAHTLHKGGSAAHDMNPTFSNAGAAASVLMDAVASSRDPFRLLLTKDLVGASILCIVKHHHSAEHEWMSRPIGPVEAAPPRAREVWISGEARVGAHLHAGLWYFGGEAGNCSFYWTRVTPDGDRLEIEGRHAEDDSADLTRVRRVLVGLEDVDSKFKLTVEPSRSDGMVAERTSARPSKTVTE